jgi:hypothetical protein
MPPYPAGPAPQGSLGEMQAARTTGKVDPGAYRIQTVNTLALPKVRHSWITGSVLERPQSGGLPPSARPFGVAPS